MFSPENEPACTLKLGDENVCTKSSEKHMGVILTDSKCEQESFIRDRVSACRRAYYAVQSLGTRRAPVPPHILSKLYWSVGMSKMMYGLEMLSLSERSVQILEQAHGSIAKLIQGLPRQTINATCIAPIGWISVEAFIDLMKMMFLWRVLSLPVNNIYKQIAIIRVASVIYMVINQGILVQLQVW